MSKTPAFIHRDFSAVVLDDGEVVPVTNWFDARGLPTECRCPHCVAAIVAGPDANGQWHTMRGPGVERTQLQ